jgi:hypothetical protein
MLGLHLPVKFIGVRRIDLRQRMSLALEILFALCAEEFLEYHCIPSVSSKQGVRDISQNRYKANAKIQDNIEHHFRLDPVWESSFDLLAGAQNHHGHKSVDNISDTAEKNRQHIV